MKIESISELRKLIRMLQAEGCSELSTPELTLRLTDAPKASESVTNDTSTQNDVDEEALLFWSAHNPEAV